MTFVFGDGFRLHDVTPVDNRFIQECLPAAKGDYVKVYLYGLMYCYHPEDEMTADQMSHDLDLTREEIDKACRYWERQGLMQRISDTPPVWRYVHMSQRKDRPEEYDLDYAAFSNAIYDVFDNGRRLHGGEIQTCYEWVEDLKLPVEAVIMILKHQASVMGKNFSIRSADRIAVRMAEEGITSLEEAEAFLSRDKKAYDGIKKVLRKLGKRGSPSEAQVDYYRKWTGEWHFTPEAVEEACADTAKGDPSVGYLDGILKNLRESLKGVRPITPGHVRAAREQGDRARTVLGILGVRNAGSQAMETLRELRETYPEEVIMIGARECSQSGRGLEELKKLLLSWRQKGLTTREEVESYVSSFHAQNEILRRLQGIWKADEPRIGDASRKVLRRWQEELGFREDVILRAAEYASEAKAPMRYLDRILQAYDRQGIRTLEEVERSHDAFLKEQGIAAPRSGGKTVTAQEYSQRDYSEKQKQAMDLFIRMNGGEPDA